MGGMEGVRHGEGEKRGVGRRGEEIGEREENKGEGLGGELGAPFCL